MHDEPSHIVITMIGHEKNSYLMYGNQRLIEHIIEDVQNITEKLNQVSHEAVTGIEIKQDQGI